MSSRKAFRILTAGFESEIDRRLAVRFLILGLVVAIATHAKAGEDTHNWYAQAPSAKGAEARDALWTTSWAMGESARLAAQAKLDAEKARAAAEAAAEKASRWVVNGSLYAGAIDYVNSAAKKSAAYTGAYASLGFDSRNVLELACDRLNVDFTALGERSQTDATAVFTHFVGSSWKVRAGGHFTGTDAAISAGGEAAILGLYTFETGRHELGFDLYRSSYRESTPAIEAWQVSPRVGLLAGRIRGGTFWNELTAHLIYLDRDPGIGAKDLFSAEEKLTFTRNRWSATASLWSGNQAYALRDAGFLVFNLAEEHTGGSGLQLRYAGNDHWSFAARASKEQFKDIGTSVRAEADNYALVVGHTF